MSAKTNSVSLTAGIVRDQFVPILIGYALSVLVGSVVIWFTTGVEPVSAYLVGLKSAFLPSYNFLSSLWRMVPLLLTALGVSIAFRTGVFNVGGDGQFYLGAFAAVWTGFSLQMSSSFVHVLLCIVAGLIAGAAWAFIPAFLKTRFRVNEVVSCIMMNSISFLLIDNLIVNKYKAPIGAGETTRSILSTARIDPFIPLSSFNFFFFISIGLSLLVLLLFKKTTLGYEFKIIGLNERAAKYSGLAVNKRIIAAMLMSGAFSGLAGALKVIGEQYVMRTGMNGTIGFRAIIVSLISRGNPLLILITSFLLALTESSSVGMEIAKGIPSSISMIMESIFMFAVIIYSSLSNMRNEGREG